MEVHLEYYPRQNANPMEFSQFLNQKLPREDELSKLNIRLSSPLLSNHDLNEFFYRTRHLKVESLNLSFNKLSDSNIPIIITGIRTNRYVRKLILSHNEIQNEGAKALADLMFDRRDLDIELCYNQIGPEGGLSLLQSAIHTVKTKLDLSNNKIGNEGARLMGDCLSEQTGALSQLILRHNDIDTEGDVALAEKVPGSVKVHHRVKMVSFLESHPFLSVFLIIIFFPSIFILHMMKSEVYLEGCEHRPVR